MKKNSKDAACSALEKSIGQFDAKVSLGMPTTLTAQGRKLRRKLSAPAGTLADKDARRFAGQTMISEMVEHHKRTKGKAYRHFLVTICWDAGVVNAAGPFDYDLSAMRRKAYKSARDVGLCGVFVFEVVPLRRSLGLGESLLIHLHGACWTKDPAFQPEVSARQLSRRFKNSLGAPSVTIQSRQKAATKFRNKRSDIYAHLFSELDEDQSEESMAWLGYYLFQAPAWAKQIVPKRDRGDRFAMRSCQKGYSPQLAISLHKLLSEIEWKAAVFSVGTGKAVLSPWRTKCRLETKPKPAGKKPRNRNSIAKVRKRRARLLARMGRPDTTSLAKAAIPE